MLVIFLLILVTLVVLLVVLIFYHFFDTPSYICNLLCFAYLLNLFKNSDQVCFRLKSKPGVSICLDTISVSNLDLASLKNNISNIVLSMFFFCYFEFRFEVNRLFYLSYFKPTFFIIG
jgi:hypothetical protein